jgi:hypothetical protein
MATKGAGKGGFQRGDLLAQAGNDRTAAATTWP